MNANQSAPEYTAGLPKRRPLRFTLRGVMVFIAGIAAGAVEAQLEHPRWGDAVLTCLSEWAALGLAHQIADMWHASSKWTTLPADERWGARLGIAWRAAVILLLIAHYCIRTLLAGKQLSLPGAELGPFSFSFEPATALWSAFLCLLLMFILWSIPRLRRPARRRPVIHFCMQLIAALCGAALCLVLWWRLGWIHFLVNVACTWLTRWYDLPGL